jgi:diacylglycerol kinase family enzyme
VPQPFTAGLLHNADRSSRFFLMAGVGFDGHIVRGVSLKEKSRFGKGAYLLSALRSLVAWDAGVLQVTTATESFSCGSLIICNASRYGGSFSLAPSASMFSPTFEIIAITQSSRRAAIRGAACTAVGRSDAAWLYRTTAAKIKIVGEKPVQADGDDWGDAPIELVAEPHYAKIIL